MDKGQYVAEKAVFAVLAWEAGKVPRGLRQLEKLKGNSTNPQSFDFPVVIERIQGACAETIIQHPNRQVLGTMINRARELQARGIKGITTSCGFNAVFQKEIASAVKIPFFSSSLLQLPYIRSVYGNDRDIIVITARKANLKPEHFFATGTTDLSHIHIYGMREESKEWLKMNTYFDAEIDIEILYKDFVKIAEKALCDQPDAAAFLFECTDMPPFSQLVRGVTGLPVFDFVTMTNYFYAAVCGSDRPVEGPQL